MSDNIFVSTKGRWVSVPSVKVNDNNVTITGQLPRIAAVHDEAWAEKETTEPQTYVNHLKSLRWTQCRADVFTFTQMLPDLERKYTYHMEPESIAAVPIASYREWWESLPQGTRKNVRRAEKRGVEVRVRQHDDEVIEHIVTLNNDSPVRQGRPNRHFGKSFDEVKRDYASFHDRSDLICAYLGDELIGLLKLVYRGRVASVLQCLPKQSHLDKNPANALIAKAVELCEARGIGYMTYGLFHYGGRLDSSLREFKVRNGFVEFLVPRYYAPISGLGKVCIQMGLHRGWKSVAPKSVISAGAALRGKWHTYSIGRSSVVTRTERE